MAWPSGVETSWKPPKEMLTTSSPMSAAVTNADSSSSSLAEPHHWEIFSATRLTLGAIPLMPVPLRAAAMRPPIQDPCPFQSVVTGPPNSAARSLSETPKASLQIPGASSKPVESTTALTLGASSLG